MHIKSQGCCSPRGEFKFIDLFAGLGGFHLALQRCGGKCVFACERDETLRNVYFDNFSILPTDDIRSVIPNQVPDHDVLCAGFPCQSFSKAGRQRGLGCEKNGDLIYHVIDIIRAKLPRFLLLENVANFEKHDGGETWRLVRSVLEDLGYTVKSSILSPHHFGIPQVRERIFIVASRQGLGEFYWPSRSLGKPSIRKILSENPHESKHLSNQLIKCLDVWQEFLDLYPAEDELPSFPIWSMEFGASYPYEPGQPTSYSVEELRLVKGSHGQSLTGETLDQLVAQLPSHARSVDPFPKWKTDFIRQNRNLYMTNKDWLDSWIPKIREFPPSFQKFEWNCKGEKRNLWELVIQIRASGVRVKRDTSAPSLIAMTTTQVPIIAWERRYMTPRECASLQSFPSDLVLPKVATRAYKALGNAVNAELVYLVADQLIDLPAPKVEE
jgi:DNA (cytosine-5)-methyltransferase 1